jgi:hypothetical protein
MSPSVDRSDAVTLGGVCGNGDLGPCFFAITFGCKTSHSPLQLREFDCECVIGESEGEDHLSRSLSHVSEAIIMQSDVVFKQSAFVSMILDAI